MRNPQSSKEGFLFVDHRASPGLPADIARKMGYDPEVCREGKIYEAATYTCPHCGRVVIKNPERVRMRERCNSCDTYVCDWCAAAMRKPDYVHQPMMKKKDDLVDDFYHHPDQYLPLRAPRKE
jgi:hypothetical protein